MGTPASVTIISSENHWVREKVIHEHRNDRAEGWDYMNQGPRRFRDLKESLHEQLSCDWTIRDGVYIPNQSISAKNLSQYESAQGTNQAERSLDATESGFYDLPRYAELLNSLLDSCPGRPIVVADLGCGSGRATQILLQNDNTLVLCIDFNESDLRRILSSLDKPDAERIIPICASLDYPIPISEICDFVLLIEVLSTFENIDKPLAVAHDMLRMNGKLIISDPAPESQFIHALLNKDLRNIESILKNGIYTDKVGEHDVELHFRSREELQRKATKAGFSFQDYSTFPGTAAVLLHRLKQEGTVAKHLEFVARVNDFSNHTLTRISVSQLTKVKAHET